jgi:FkbM family methyltransferase
LIGRITNRLQMARRALACRIHLENWREAEAAFRSGSRGTTLRFRNGFTLIGTDRDQVAHIFYEIFIDRCYTPRWFYHPEPDHSVVDIGANIGVFCTYLGYTAPGILVRAFEPHQATFESLTRNLGANRLADRVAAHRVAVGREAGVVRFTGLTGLASGHEAAVVGGSGEPVECTPIAAVLDGLDTVDLLKVDTEGAEVDILEPAPADMREKVARVVVEYHDLAKREGVVLALEARGYRCLVRPARGFEHHLGLVYGMRG